MVTVMVLERKSIVLFLDFSLQNIQYKTSKHIIIIIISIIIIVISFMQGIYTYIPETNHVPREYSVSAILSLLFMVSTT